MQGFSPALWSKARQEYICAVFVETGTANYYKQAPIHNSFSHCSPCRCCRSQLAMIRSGRSSCSSCHSSISSYLLFLLSGAPACLWCMQLSTCVTLSLLGMCLACGLHLPRSCVSVTNTSCPKSLHPDRRNYVYSLILAQTRAFLSLNPDKNIVVRTSRVEMGLVNKRFERGRPFGKTLPACC